MTDHHLPREALPLRWQATFLVAVLVVSILAWQFGGLVPEANGLGWDGLAYARMTRSLPDLLGGHGVSSYYAARLLPCAIVWSGLRVLGLAMTDAMLIDAFRVLNLVCVLASAGLWIRIACISSLSKIQFVIGAVGLFLAFPTVRMFFFVPVLVDAMALLLGMAALCAFLERRWLVLTGVGLISAFSWSAGAFLCLLLLAFRPERVETSVPPIGWQIALAVTAIAFGMTATAVLASDGACLAMSQSDAWQSLAQAGSIDDVCEKMRSLATAIPSFALIGLAALQLLGGKLEALRALRSVHWPRAALGAAVLLVLPWLAIQRVSDPTLVEGTPLRRLIYFLLFPQEGKLFLPFVSTVAYWGPLAIIAVLFWRKIAETVRALGLGMILLHGCALILVLVTEPRFLNWLWPFVAFSMIKTLPQLKLADAKFAYLFIALALIWSKFWLPMSTGVWPGGPLDGLDTWPKQLYFGNFGFWMAWPAFLLQGAVLVASMAVIWRRRRYARTGVI